ncbi:MAG: hypothetical protein H6811_12395 [Phycisphaeraceae bacterium]|nr:hypothetical protein [Phycisphaeraceae bacterium]
MAQAMAVALSAPETPTASVSATPGRHTRQLENDQASLPPSVAVELSPTVHLSPVPPPRGDLKASPAVDDPPDLPATTALDPDGHPPTRSDHTPNDAQDPASPPVDAPLSSKTQQLSTPPVADERVTYGMVLLAFLPWLLVIFGAGPRAHWAFFVVVGLGSLLALYFLHRRSLFGIAWLAMTMSSAAVGFGVLIDSAMDVRWPGDWLVGRWSLDADATSSQWEKLFWADKRRDALAEFGLEFREALFSAAEDREAIQKTVSKLAGISLEFTGDGRFWMRSPFGEESGSFGVSAPEKGALVIDMKYGDDPERQEKARLADGYLEILEGAEGFTLVFSR